jgi:hypothetical protein
VMQNAILKSTIQLKLLYDGRLRATVRCISGRTAQKLRKALGGRVQGPSLHLEGDALLRLASSVGSPPGALHALQEYRRVLPGQGRRLEEPDRARKMAHAENFLWFMQQVGWDVHGL